MKKKRNKTDKIKSVLVDYGLSCFLAIDVDELSRSIANELDKPESEETQERQNSLRYKGVESLREISIRCWNSLTTSNKIDLMGHFEGYAGCKPSSLTESEIENLFFGDRIKFINTKNK